MILKSRVYPCLPELFKMVSVCYDNMLLDLQSSPRIGEHTAIRKEADRLVSCNLFPGLLGNKSPKSKNWFPVAITNTKSGSQRFKRDNSHCRHASQLNQQYPLDASATEPCLIIISSIDKEVLSLLALHSYGQLLSMLSRRGIPLFRAYLRNRLKISIIILKCRMGSRTHNFSKIFSKYFKRKGNMKRKGGLERKILQGSCKQFKLNE